MKSQAVRSAKSTVVLALVIGLLLAGLHSLAEAAPTVTLEQAVHFAASDGSDVVAEAGTYQVDVSASQLSLTAEGRAPLLLEAKPTTHSEKIDSPLAVLVPGDDPDLLHVVLLQPNDQALDAPGSLSGTRSRGNMAMMLATPLQIQFAVAQQAPKVMVPGEITGSTTGALPQPPVQPAAVGSWSYAHGDAANTGFANVITAPGTLPIRKVTGLGSYAPGAGPVIAADGTVYLGNSQGQLRALTAAGDQKWMRDTPGRKIVASPVVGADGSIYVVGTMAAREHRGGSDYLRFFATLYRFDSGGAMLWVQSFPERRGMGAGATSAAPNIWRSGSTEVIIVPVLYSQLGVFEFFLEAFSTTGALLFEQKVTSWAPTTTGGASVGDVLCAINPFPGSCLPETVLAPGPNQLPTGVEPPMPSVGIFAGSGGVAPIVVVSDNYQNLVGYNFSPTQGFQEIFRKHLTNDWLRISSPAVLRDGHSVIRGNGSKQAWALFGGPNSVNWTEVVTPLTGATPTITADGRIVMVDRGGGVTVIGTYPGRSVLNRVQLEAESIAPAAASCSHVFVSTASALVTLDAKATTVVARFDWRTGGVSSPAIGPDGRVYVLAGEGLHIFPAPPQSKLGAIGGIASCQGGGLLISP